jgi:hypothetical protein
VEENEEESVEEIGSGIVTEDPPDVMRAEMTMIDHQEGTEISSMTVVEVVEDEGVTVEIAMAASVVDLDATERRVLPRHQKRRNLLQT